MNTQNLCLGVLHFCDASGYEIKQMFESTFSHFQNPGYGSIYPALEKLQQADLVTVRVEEQEKRPAKKVYHITDSGRERFQTSLYETTPDEVCKSDFVLLAFFAHLLDTDKFQSILHQHVENLENDLNKLLSIENQESMPVGMRFTIDYGVFVKRARLQFLQDRMTSLLRHHRIDKTSEDSA